MNEVKAMTPAEAWDFADLCVSNISMGRPAHIKGMQAMAILKQFIPVEPPTNGNGYKQEGEPQEEEKDASAA